MENAAGAWIKRVRQAAKLTQEQLASRIGKSVYLVRRWESGRQLATFADVAMIARALHLPEPRLDGGELELSEVVDGLRRLTRELAAVKNLLRQMASEQTNRGKGRRRRV